MLTLYHGRTSVCAIKARIMLAEKGLEWQGRLLTLRGDQFDPAYLELNPNAVVPTLVHDDKVIIESSVILYYLDDAFPEPSLMPKAPVERSRVYLTNKLIDEYVHDSCTTLTFATANRANTLKMSREAFEAELAKTPNTKRREIKRQVAEHGLDAPYVIDAVKHHLKLLDRIETAMESGRYIAGDSYSIADIAATPYIWRLEQLRLSSMWNNRPGVAGWYERIRARPSFDKAINQVVSPEDFERYRSFQPDPWPQVSDILKAA